MLSERPGTPIAIIGTRPGHVNVRYLLFIHPSDARRRATCDGGRRAPAVHSRSMDPRPSLSA